MKTCCKLCRSNFTVCLFENIQRSIIHASCGGNRVSTTETTRYMNTILPWVFSSNRSAVPKPDPSPGRPSRRLFSRNCDFWNQEYAKFEGSGCGAVVSECKPDASWRFAAAQRFVTGRRRQLVGELLSRPHRRTHDGWERRVYLAMLMEERRYRLKKRHQIRTHFQHPFTRFATILESFIYFYLMPMCCFFFFTKNFFIKLKQKWWNNNVDVISFKFCTL